MKSCLFVGDIEHRRFAPVKHEFTYSVCYYYLDVEEIPKIFRVPFLFSYNFPGLLSFWRKNYLKGRSGTIREVVASIIKEKTGNDFDGPIRMLTNISYFGYCFNPVTFYYCYDREENLKYILSNVTNTPWGENHIDFLTFKGGDKDLFSLPKSFHVSPFMPMEIDYKWVFNIPQNDIYVLMQNRHSGTDPLVFDSTLKLKRKELNFQNVLTYFLRFPFVTFKTSLAIYYHAGILYFLKKIPFYTHPNKRKNS